MPRIPAPPQAKAAAPAPVRTDTAPWAD
jgi:hypothetical protein